MFVVKKKIQVTRRQFYQPRQAVIRAGKKTQLHAYPAYYVRTLEKNGHHAPTYTVKLDRQSEGTKTVPRWNKKMETTLATTR